MCSLEQSRNGLGDDSSSPLSGPHNKSLPLSPTWADLGEKEGWGGHLLGFPQLVSDSQNLNPGFLAFCLSLSFLVLPCFASGSGVSEALGDAGCRVQRQVGRRSFGHLHTQNMPHAFASVDGHPEQLT